MRYKVVCLWQTYMSTNSILEGAYWAQKYAKNYGQEIQLIDTDNNNTPLPYETMDVSGYDFHQSERAKSRFYRSDFK